MPRLKVGATILSLVTLLAAPVLAQSVSSARPGTLNYVEGNASIDGRAITSRSVGSTSLNEGSILATANGKVEVLLTPGVFLRIDENSTIKMISPTLTRTEVEIQRGRAQVEVDELYAENDIQIDQAGGQTLLLKNGLYEFDADAGSMRVFDGEAAAYEGNAPQSESKAIKVKDDHELALAGTAVKPQKFDVKAASNSELFKWGSLRSEYLGQANENLAQSYAGSYPGYGPWASGWMWDPSLYSYTWLPGNGLFRSPFGYGFYSPYYLYGGGFFVNRPFGGFRHGFVGRPGYVGGFRGGFHAGRPGGFQGGGAGFHAGRPGGFQGGTGFHAGRPGGFQGGGFHGGASGGGSHAGGGHR